MSDHNVLSIIVSKYAPYQALGERDPLVSGQYSVFTSLIRTSSKGEETDRPIMS